MYYSGLTLFDSRASIIPQWESNGGKGLLKNELRRLHIKDISSVAAKACYSEEVISLSYSCGIHSPATPSYRISRACRICRRDVYWSMVSGNPSSSSLVTDNSLANPHHPAQRRSFPASISGAGHATHAEPLPDRKSPTGLLRTVLTLAHRYSRRRKVHLARIPAT